MRSWSTLGSCSMPVVNPNLTNEAGEDGEQLELDIENFQPDWSKVKAKITDRGFRVEFYLDGDEQTTKLTSRAIGLEFAKGYGSSTSYLVETWERELRNPANIQSDLRWGQVHWSEWDEDDDQSGQIKTVLLTLGDTSDEEGTSKFLNSTHALIEKIRSANGEIIEK